MHNNIRSQLRDWHFFKVIVVNKMNSKYFDMLYIGWRNKLQFNSQWCYRTLGAARVLGSCLPWPIGVGVPCMYIVTFYCSPAKKNGSVPHFFGRPLRKNFCFSHWESQWDCSKIKISMRSWARTSLRIKNLIKNLIQNREPHSESRTSSRTSSKIKILGKTSLRFSLRFSIRIFSHWESQWEKQIFFRKGGDATEGVNNLHACCRAYK